MNPIPSPVPPNLFAFERDEFSDLNWMPLAFRYRLDVCGLKMGLASWLSLPFSERISLLGLSFGNENEQVIWAARLKSAMAVCGLGEPVDLERWVDPGTIPDDVKVKWMECSAEMDFKEWSRLKPIHRYALCKLARGKQADRYLIQAVLEFRGAFSRE